MGIIFLIFITTLLIACVIFISHNEENNIRKTKEITWEERWRFIKKLQKTFNEKYEFGHPMNDEGTHLFIPSSMGGVYSYMFYDTEKKQTCTMTLDEETLDDYVQQWLDSGEAKIEII